jgi:hypothetical protein
MADRFSLIRNLGTLIGVPGGVLLGGAAAESEMGGPWGLWLAAGIAWITVSGLISIIIWHRMTRASTARRQ